MKVVSIGGGPGGLFFSILLKKSRPDADIVVYERNRPDDTFGWGVVFSDETLGNIEAADPESMAEIRANFRYWDAIETFYGGTCERSTGHGFCGMSRKLLLQILHARCRELGVRLEFEHDVDDDGIRRHAEEADLVLAADGVNSRVRELWADDFRPSIDWRQCKFAWFGTDLELEAFTFVFKETEHGLFQVHAYPFDDGLSTWIVECHEDVWRRAGLDRASEAESVAFCEKLFADDLRGHRILTNRSMWRTFPTIRNATWHRGNVVLIGDSAHTAHFSIGSGTKLAMEDAIALHDAFVDHEGDGVEAVLRSYEDARYVEVIKTQKAAQTSLEWFENSARYLGQGPATFSFNLMTRSKRITYDNLTMRDPELVRRAAAEFAAANGLDDDPAQPRPPMFAPFTVRDVELDNRIVVSPMCQYSCDGDGVPTDWHFVHLGSRAVGGAGLVFTEMTNVSADGRITPGCTGLWNDGQATAWKRIVDFVHANSTAKIGIQLAHAGRKGSVSHPWRGDDVPLPAADAWPTIAPSAEPFRPEWPAPKAMDRAAMDRVVAEFVTSTELADRAGFDVVELHMAHGYLLSSFISPLSNRRDDEYGGSLEGRMRFPLEVLRAVRETWGNRPLFVRISASDWAGDDGLTGADAVEVSRLLAAAGCDVVDVSSGGNSAEHVPEYGRMYQVPFAERIRVEVGVPVMAVGAILGADHANTVLCARRADLCALARPHLRDPYLTLNASRDYDYAPQRWPGQYELGR